jgi:DNA gyrase subunit A
LTPAKEVWAVILPDGTAARTSDDKLPRVSGKQAAGWLLKTDTHHTLYLASVEGKAAAISVEALPVSDDLSGGLPVWKISPLRERDQLAAVFNVPPRTGEQERYVMTATRLGLVKKTAIQELPGPSSQLFTLAKVNGGDSLIWAGITDGDSELFLATEGGMAIRFSENEVRPMGLVAAGVNGIKLKAGDCVTGAERLVAGDEILIVASNGRGWRSLAEEFPLQGRYGQGVIGCKLPRGAKLIGILVGKRTQSGIAHYSQAAARLLRVDAVASGKRAGMGAEALPVKSGDALVSITPMLDGFEPWIEKKKPATARKRRESAASGA